jgi:hypothetical protein
MCRWVRIRWLNVDLIWEQIVKVGTHYLGLFTVYGSTIFSVWYIENPLVNIDGAGVRPKDVFVISITGFRHPDKSKHSRLRGKSMEINNGFSYRHGCHLPRVSIAKLAHRSSRGK